MEALLTLLLTSFLILSVSGTVRTTFQSVQETLFFLEFEQFYKDSQMLSVSSNQSVTLSIGQTGVTNGVQTVVLPPTVQLAEERHIVFEEDGGNSSLANIEFHTNRKIVRYQLYLGSGRYKKTEK